MSWQQYVDSSLVGTGHIDKAAIFSRAGDSVWAASPGFNISPDEMKKLVHGFKDASSLQADGLYIAGEKQVVLTAESDIIIGKKGKEGVICAVTQQAILIAHYPETVQPGQARVTVEKLSDYLKGVGY